VQRSFHDRVLDGMRKFLEDHAMAATFPPGTVLPAHWRVIGQVRRGEGVRVNGQPYQGRAGWDHFI